MSDSPRSPGQLSVDVLFSPAPREVLQRTVQLDAGAVVRDAVRGALAAWGLGLPDGAVLAVWGRKAGADQPLREGDRVEILRPLQVDPKEARRLRYRRQGEKGRAVRPRKAVDSGGC